MLSKEDSVYLNDKDYNMPLEKFFVPEIYAEGDRVSGNGTVCKAYPFSNEDLPRMFENINNSKSRVLTVGSSGDQFLNAVYYGAKDITVLDGNLFTKPYIDYKVAAIKNLTYEEFRYYFLLKKDPFCRAVYSKIFQDLPEDSQEFFGTIFLEQSNSKDTYNTICHKDDVFDEQIQSSFFAEPSSYMKLQDKLLKNDYDFQVINAEFADFNNHCKGKYDVVLLSNIYQYVSLRQFGKVVLPLCENHLTDNAVVQLYYEFGYSLWCRNVKFQKWLKDKVSTVKLGLGDTAFLLYNSDEPREKSSQDNNLEMECL